MRRLTLSLLLLLALILAGCGGGSHHNTSSTNSTQSSAPTGPSAALRSPTQRTYKVKLPNGQTVTQIHDPALAAPPRSQRPKAWALTITPTVEQYDSVTTSTIPQGAQYVAGYVDGLYQTYWGMRGHYPHVLGISVRSQDGADCLDEEPGNPGPSATGPWVKWQLSQGNARPCIYSMLSWFSQINANLSAWGIARSQVREWDANWTYVPHLDWGYDCTQWTDRSRGLNLDESTCATAFYPQPPKPKPDPFLLFPNVKLTTPFGALYERLTVEQYVGARAHPSSYATYLKRTLEPRVGYLAARVAFLACHGKNLGLFNLPCDWKSNRFGSRYQYLSKAALGQTISVKP